MTPRHPPKPPRVVLYDPATCPHEWVLPGIQMPEGYWKPVGPITCRWCGALRAA